MKKFLFICGICLFCSSTGVAAPFCQHRLPSLKSIFGNKPENGTVRTQSPTRAEDGRWIAGKEIMSVWSGIRWVKAEENTLSFNEYGQTVVQFTAEVENGRITGYTRTTNTYNDNGMVIERFIEGSTNGMIFYPTDKRIVAYDPILTDVIISNEQTVWNDGEEMEGNCYHFDITRNDEGNIVLAERAVLFGGIYDPTERFVVEYGDDGKAVSASQSQLGYNGREYYWIETQKVYDITWVETDGQICNINSMMGGKNKMKSAKMYDNNDKITLYMEFAYEDDGSYSITYSDTNEPLLVAHVTVTPLPYGGSTTMTTEEYDGTVYLTIEETVEYAPNGLILRAYYCREEDGEETYIEQSAGEFTGDEERPTSYEYNVYNNEEDEWYPNMRVEFSDYTYFPYHDAGVDAVGAASEEQAEYFNLQGIKITSPEKGTTCIERRGNITRKIIVR